MSSTWKAPRSGLTSTPSEEAHKPLLIVGLGNPGKAYARTRHNAGFLVVEELARRWNIRFSEKTKLKAEIAEGSFPTGKRLLMKPTTYMNHSGEAVQAVAAWQKPGKIIAVSDDADLPFGEIRVRQSGGSAGHNGIASLITSLGTDAFTRVRVGIGRPSDTRIHLEDWVLGKWSKEEEKRLAEVVGKAVEMVISISHK